jgi:hypothetical protein
MPDLALSQSWFAPDQTNAIGGKEQDFSFNVTKQLK